MTSGTGADEKRVDLVFEGGGVKGIGLAGAFGFLEEQGFQAQRVAGTSAGAINAALVAAGYSGDELRELVLEKMKFKSFEDGGHWWGAQAKEMLVHKGLHPGKVFESWMRGRLEEKGVTKFGQLRLPPVDGSDEVQYRLQVIASDLSAQRMLVLPQDAAQLGADPDELEIAAAVRMSMSIPIFFDPVVFEDPRNASDKHVIVDGGILSNFPVWLFDVPDGQVPRWPTFGLLLVAPNQKDPLVPRPMSEEADEDRMSMLRFLLAIGHTMMEAHDRLYVEQANYARTIPINTLGVQTTQFSIDDDGDLKQALYQSGRDAAAAFLKTWNFDDYIKAFRSGKQPTRREATTAVINERVCMIGSRTLGNGGLEVSVIGLGCNNFGRRVDLDGTRAVVDAALELGVTFFDTADIYGRGQSEELLGQVLDGRRDEVTLATKFGMDMGDGRGPRGSRDYILQAVEASLRRLRTDVIDFYWYHEPDGVTPLSETLETLDELVRRGSVRSIGASNFSAQQLEEADAISRERGWPRFEAVQNHYSLLVREPERDVLPTCERLGIGFVPFFPLASGLLTGKYRRGEQAPAGTRLSERDEIATAEQFDLVEALEAYARERDVELIDVAIGALLARPVVSSVIAGATKPEQVRRNAAAADWVPSDDDIDALYRLLDAAGG